MCPEPTKWHRQSVSCHCGALGARRLLFLEPGKGERGGGLLGTAKWRSRGLECVEEKGKEGPRRRLWMVGDRRWQWRESGGCGWRSGGAIEAHAGGFGWRGQCGLVVLGRPKMNIMIFQLFK
jgi:hypothetical protein